MQSCTVSQMLPTELRCRRLILDRKIIPQIETEEARIWRLSQLCMRLCHFGGQPSENIQKPCSIGIEDCKMRQQLPSRADEASRGLYTSILKSSISYIFLVTERGVCCTTEKSSIYVSPCFSELHPFQIINRSKLLESTNYSIESFCRSS